MFSVFIPEELLNSAPLDERSPLSQLFDESSSGEGDLESRIEEYFPTIGNIREKSSEEILVKRGKKLFVMVFYHNQHSHPLYLDFTWNITFNRLFYVSIRKHINSSIF